MSVIAGILRAVHDEDDKSYSTDILTTITAVSITLGSCQMCGHEFVSNQQTNEKREPVFDYELDTAKYTTKCKEKFKI